jgi:predicted nuclease of predicted toxin-antitoxin system
VKLLLDENLSSTLVQRLSKAFRGTLHADQVGLRSRPDIELWDFAAENGLVIVSKDSDFKQLSFLFGHPPKVIWLSVGDAGTEAIASLILSHRARLESFQSDENDSLLVLEIAATSSKRVVYVRLLGEGTLVDRPTSAILVGPDLARLSMTEGYDFADEDWEFKPGAVVRLERRVLHGKEIDVAIAAIE